MPEAAAQAESEAPVPTSINFFEEATALKEQLIAWRRDIHQMPEIGLETPSHERLHSIGAYQARHSLPHDHQRFGRCGSHWRRRTGALWLRSDIDGLPMAEESGEEFASINGNMHACGHDMHAATLLGAAHILKAHESELKGTVKLFFQPGEEGYNGSDEELQKAYRKPARRPRIRDAWSRRYPRASSYGERPMAAAYNWKIVAEGVAGRDPCPTRASTPSPPPPIFISRLQEILAREISHERITCGVFNAGDAGNAIPQSATMQGTIRVFDKKTEELAKNASPKSQAESHKPSAAQPRRPSAARALRCLTKNSWNNASNTPSRRFPKRNSTAAHTAWAPKTPGRFPQACTANYMMIGAAAGPLNECYGQHNPHVRFDENALPMSSALYASVAMNWLDDNAK